MINGEVFCVTKSQFEENSMLGESSVQPVNIP
jgi:hypothetical protein